MLTLPSSWGARTQTLSVLTSPDGTTYNTAVASASYTFDPSTTNTVTIVISASNVRAVRLNFTANTGWTAAQLSEFQVYGS
jgi:cupin superfamily acireductone dioxygenase involved in methionine salvage